MLGKKVTIFETKNNWLFHFLFSPLIFLGGKRKEEEITILSTFLAKTADFDHLVSIFLYSDVKKSRIS